MFGIGWVAKNVLGLDWEKKKNTYMLYAVGGGLATYGFVQAVGKSKENSLTIANTVGLIWLGSVVLWKSYSAEEEKARQAKKIEIVTQKLARVEVKNQELEAENRRLWDCCNNIVDFSLAQLKPINEEIANVTENAKNAIELLKDVVNRQHAGDKRTEVLENGLQELKRGVKEGLERKEEEKELTNSMLRDTTNQLLDKMNDIETKLNKTANRISQRVQVLEGMRERENNIVDNSVLNEFPDGLRNKIERDVNNQKFNLTNINNQAGLNAGIGIPSFYYTKPSPFFSSSFQQIQNRPALINEDSNEKKEGGPDVQTLLTAEDLWNITRLLKKFPK